jgi:preprotein translocase subunit YajC
MAFLDLMGISDVFAAASPAQAGQGQASLSAFLPMILIFFLGAYFLMIRPQNRRMRAHRKLLTELAKGDEVVTVGGLVGKIVKMHNDFVILSIAENVDINIQKSAISNLLPKGTIKTIT